MANQRSEKVLRFTDLEVWRKSHDLFLHLLVDLELLPNTRAAAIFIDQVIRSLGSVGANIAEGFNRSKAKYLNSLDIALGEANETENWLYKLRDSNLLAREKANGHVAEVIQVEKMLAGLMRSIRRQSP
jgi:four helix bundle protein